MFSHTCGNVRTYIRSVEAMRREKSRDQRSPNMKCESALDYLTVGARARGTKCHTCTRPVTSGLHHKRHVRDVCGWWDARELSSCGSQKMTTSPASNSVASPSWSRTVPQVLINSVRGHNFRRPMQPDAHAQHGKRSSQSGASANAASLK